MVNCCGRWVGDSSWFMSSVVVLHVSGQFCISFGFISRVFMFVAFVSSWSTKCLGFEPRNFTVSFDWQWQQALSFWSLYFFCFSFLKVRAMYRNVCPFLVYGLTKNRNRICIYLLVMKNPKIWKKYWTAKGTKNCMIRRPNL